MMLSSPIIGYFDPGAALPPLQPSLNSVEFVDIEEVTPIHSPVPVVLAMTDVSATPRRTTPRILESAAAVFFCFVPVNFENV